MFVGSQSILGNLEAIKTNTSYNDTKKNSASITLHPFVSLSTRPANPSPNLQFFCASADGRIQYLLGGAILYTSFDRGTTWSSSTVSQINIPAGVTGIATNKDGSLVIIDNAGYILSRNYGQSFSARVAITGYSGSKIKDDGSVTGVVSNINLRIYFDVLTGSFIDTGLSASYTDYVITDDRKYIYVSNSSGVFYVDPITTSSSTIFSGSATGIDCSSDGRYIYASVAGLIYSSTDYGTSYANLGSSFANAKVECSRDGYSVIVVGGTSNIQYKSFTAYGTASNTATIGSSAPASVFLNDDSTFCGILSSNNALFIYDVGIDSEIVSLSTSRLVAKNIAATGESSLPTLTVSNSLNAANVLVSKTLTLRNDNLPLPTGPVALQIGSTSAGIDGSSPLAIDMGATRSSTVGSNPKLRLYNNGTSQWGLGASTSGLDYSIQGDFSHTFSANSTTISTSNSSGLYMSVPITAPTGTDVNIRPSTGNVRTRLGNWNRAEYHNDLSTASYSIQIPNGASNGYMAQSWNGYIDSNINPIRSNATKRLWRQVVDQRTSDILTVDSYNGSFVEHIRIEPSVTNQVQFTQGVRSTVINMSNTTSTIGNAKLRLYDDGSLVYGLGIQGGVLSYETPVATDTHAFYSGGVERFRANSVALRVAVPITTSAGDLTLNPAAAINMSSKSITSVANMLFTNSLTTLGAPKIRLYGAGTSKYGFGIQSSTLSYEVPATTDSHVFYVAGVEKIRASNTALRLASNMFIDVTTAGTVNYDAITFSATAVNTGTGSGPRINLGSSFSNVGDQISTCKLLISPGYGMGVGGASLNYHVPNTAAHSFYCVSSAGLSPSFIVNASGVKASVYGTSNATTINFENKQLKGYSTLFEGISRSTDYSSTTVLARWYNWETVIPWVSTNDPDNVAFRCDCVCRITRIGNFVQVLTTQSTDFPNLNIVYSVLAARLATGSSISYNTLLSSAALIPGPTTQQTVVVNKYDGGGGVVTSQLVIVPQGIAYNTLGRTATGVARAVTPPISWGYIAD